MPLLQDIQLNASYNLELHASQILGSGYKNAKVLAILDLETASIFGGNLRARHLEVYPQLPAGTPSDANSLTYLKLRLPSGTTTAIALEWIVDGSLEQVATTSLRFTVDGVAPEKREIIMRALAANGFTAVNVEVL